MTALSALHGSLVHSRRVRVLAKRISALLEPGWSVIDLGAGDGALAALVAQRDPTLSIEGYDVLARPRTAIPVHAFDGRHLPLGDQSVDAVLLVDVVHHAQSPLGLLREAKRVARRAIIIKDHRLSRPLAGATLRFMDWVGNHGHGVACPANYWPEERWRAAFREMQLGMEQYETRLGLYPWPASWLFERGLHFLARLRPEGAQ
jgi:SAM-dependent methyltransferase